MAELDLATLDALDAPSVIVGAVNQSCEREAAAHRHRRGELLGSMRGLLSVGVEDNVWIVPTIHAIWLPPHHTHSARSHGPFSGWFVFVAEDFCDDLPKQPCTIRISGLLREAVLRSSQTTWAPPDAAGARIAGVILDEIRSLPVESFGLPVPRDPRLTRIARALIENPADTRDLESWAEWAAISSRSLSRRFVVETGFTFTQWRQRARLLRALEMLAAEVPVTNIALDLGYSTVSAFISLFRRTFGETPSSYRRRL